MEFEYLVEVSAPRAFVFERMTDVEQIIENLPANVVMRAETAQADFNEGAVWIVRTSGAGRDFKIRNEVTKNIAPEVVEFHSASNRLETKGVVRFVEVGPEQTEIRATFKMKPKGLLGRILLQSIKASKRRMRERMERGSKRLAEYLENQYDGIE